MCERRKIMWFLLCALVQVASIISRRSKRSAISFCSAHLCKLLRAYAPALSAGSGGPSALRTCASCFLRRNNRENSKAYFCSAHLCKLLLAMSIGFSKKFYFCSVHLCKLLQRKCYQVRRWFQASALCTCASCFLA